MSGVDFTFGPHVQNVSRQQHTRICQLGAAAMQYNAEVRLYCR